MIPLHPVPTIKEYIYKNILSFDNDSFENDWGAYVGMPYVNFVDNGSSALKLALKAIKTRRGHKIACNIASDLRVVHTIRDFDATPIFVDSDIEFYGIDYDDFKATIANTKINTIIIDIPTANTSNIQQLINLAKKNSIKVIIYFNVYAYKQLKLSNFDIAIFSYKDEVSSIGVISTINKGYHNTIKLQKHQSITYDQNSGVDVVDIGYEFDALKFSLYYFYNYLSNISVAKDEIAFYYYEGFKNSSNIILPKNIDENSIYYFIKLRINRDTVVSNLYSKEIWTGIGKIPILFFSYYKKRYDLKIKNFPKSIENYNQILTLPYYPSLTFLQVKEIIKNIVKF
jgi:dTDP-4-amino-4,6-dideoxygalactose transaminase